MLHPSYTDLMKAANSEVEEGEAPVVNSRYSIVMATSKRARQIVDGDLPLIDGPENKKALSYAIDELLGGYIKIVGEQEEEEAEAEQMIIEEPIPEELMEAMQDGTEA